MKKFRVVTVDGQIYNSYSSRKDADAAAQQQARRLGETTTIEKWNAADECYEEVARCDWRRL